MKQSVAKLVGAVRRLVGTEPGDLVSFSDDGSGNAEYPTGDGRNITNVQSSATWKELVLHANQLLDGASGGVLQAMPLSVAASPIVDDTFILTDGSTTETWTFKAASAANEIDQSGTAAATLTDLVLRINTDSALWSAVEVTSLDTYFALAPTVQAIVYRTAVSAAADRMYGSLSTTTDITVVEFASALQNYEAGSGTESSLPATDPAVKRFGFGRAVGALLESEVHTEVHTDSSRAWDADGQAWNFLGTGALLIANNLSDLDTASTARTNLGLGTAAVLAAGVANTNLPQMDATGYPAADGSQISNVTDAGALVAASNLSDVANALTATQNLSVEVGVDVQAYDADLTSFAGLTAVSGDVIYGSGAGTWAKLAKGSDTNVLTQAAGIPSWAAPAAGGYADWVTCSTGGDHANIQAAITAGHERIVLMADLTEPANVVVPSTGIWLDLNGYTLTMADFEFTTAGAYPIYVSFNGGTITAAATDAVLFDGAADYELHLAGPGHIDMTGSSAARTINHTNAIVNARGIKITVDANQTGFNISNTSKRHTFSDIHMVGGGASANKGLRVVDGQVTIEGLTITGTWKNAVEASGPLVTSADCIVNNVIIDTGNAVEISNGGIITNLWGKTNSTVTLRNTTAGAKFAHCHGTDLDLITSNNVDLTKWYDIDCGSGGIITMVVGMTNHVYDGIRCTTAVAIQGLRHKINKCEFLGGATVGTGGVASNDNGLVNCQFGPDAGGGALTLTIDDAALRTRVGSCMSDAAVVGGSGGTVESNGTVY